MSLPTRREFLGQAAAGAVLSAVASNLLAAGRPRKNKGEAAPAAPPAPAAGGGSDARPNFLWITCEDTSPNLGCYGDTYAVTPHLDKLAGQGARFLNGFTHAPVCAPSRSGIITGMYPTTLGTLHMRSQGVPPPHVKCFTEYLRAAGYYCTNAAKTDYNFPAPVTAWDECRGGADWRGRAQDQPFFAVINILTTHESQNWDIDGKLDHDPARAPVPPYYPDTPVVRRNIARCYDQIARMDAEVGRILARLEADGLAESTVVFFYGDHGRGMTRCKRWVYDSGTRVPLLVRWPGKIAPGTVREDFACFIDFAPTLLSLAGVKIPATLQGRAFLGPQAGPEPPYIFAARDRMDEVYDIVRAVRDKKFKYIKNFQPEKPYAQVIQYAEKMPVMKEFRRLAAEGKLEGPAALFMRPHKPPEELYDIAADPHEIHNLADKPELQETLRRMRAVLEQWMKDTGDLGLVPEPQLQERMRPGGKWAVTANPVIAPAGGASPGPVTVTLTCPTEGASIAWTTDAGKKPDKGADKGEGHWNLYSGPLTFKESATLRVKACRLGYKDSGEVQAAFKVGAGT